MNKRYQSPDEYDPVLRCHTWVGPPPYEAVDCGRMKVKVGGRVMTWEEYKKTYLTPAPDEVSGAR